MKHLTFPEFMQALEDGREKDILLITNSGLKSRIICTNKKGGNKIVTLTDVGEWERVDSHTPEVMPARFTIYLKDNQNEE